MKNLDWFDARLEDNDEKSSDMSGVSEKGNGKDINEGCCMRVGVPYLGGHGVPSLGSV